MKAFGFTLLEEALKRQMRSINMLVFPSIDLLQKILGEQEHEDFINTGNGLVSCCSLTILWPLFYSSVVLISLSFVFFSPFIFGMSQIECKGKLSTKQEVAVKSNIDSSWGGHDAIIPIKI